MFLPLNWLTTGSSGLNNDSNRRNYGSVSTNAGFHKPSSNPVSAYLMSYIFKRFNQNSIELSEQCESLKAISSASEWFRTLFTLLSLDMVYTERQAPGCKIDANERRLPCHLPGEKVLKSNNNLLGTPSMVILTSQSIIESMGSQDPLDTNG